MRTIIRSAEPACLASQPPSQEWRTFMLTPCHGDLHQNLRQEQNGLCCYCELEVEDDHGHIEHMEPRSHNRARTYDYSNLAVSCNGGHTEHCGHYKDNRSGYSWDVGRFLPPHDSATKELLTYVPDGSVQATASDPGRASYLIGYLGLDCPRLTDRRREHARSLIDTLGDQPPQDLVDWLRKEYLQTNAHDRLKQFYSLSKQILEP
jgi:uncharacterized protein (TIGR02646 family)